jgi:hypothetical protein
MKIIIIKKTSTVGLICKKNIGLNNLYKRAGFKKNNDFNKRHTWEVKDAFISIYARDTGRANTENKCELPPPIDTTLYFGSMVVIKHADKTPSDENLLDLSLSEWEKIYESLFGGFEDLGSEEESEEDYVPPENLTKHGYEKDGFVVEDGEVEYSKSADSDGDSEEYFPSANSEETDDSLEDTGLGEGEEDTEEDITNIPSHEEDSDTEITSDNYEDSEGELLDDELSEEEYEY